MCYGHVDLRTIEREVHDRLRATAPKMAAKEDASVTLPPSLTPGLRGVFARVQAALLAVRSARAS